MLAHELQVALQYVVRTNFELLRHKQTQDFSAIALKLSRERLKNEVMSIILNCLPFLCSIAMSYAS
jgi:hypothetical protein